jgi:hypothetical protein
MLGRKDFTQDELDAARAAVDQQLTAYRALAEAVAAGTSDDDKVGAALQQLGTPVFNGLALALDRRFVHRVRMVTGKDGGPLNELELIAESLMNNDGVLRGNNVVRYVPEQSVLQLQPGDRITLTAEDLERLSGAVFAELEARFVH